MVASNALDGSLVIRKPSSSLLTDASEHQFVRTRMHVRGGDDDASGGDEYPGTEFYDPETGKMGATEKCDDSNVDVFETQVYINLPNRTHPIKKPHLKIDYCEYIFILNLFDKLQKTIALYDVAQATSTWALIEFSLVVGVCHRIILLSDSRPPQHFLIITAIFQRNLFHHVEPYAMMEGFCTDRACVVRRTVRIRSNKACSSLRRQENPLPCTQNVSSFVAERKGFLS